MVFSGVLSMSSGLSTQTGQQAELWGVAEQLACDVAGSSHLSSGTVPTVHCIGFLLLFWVNWLGVLCSRKESATLSYLGCVWGSSSLSPGLCILLAAGGQLALRWGGQQELLAGDVKYAHRLQATQR